MGTPRHGREPPRRHQEPRDLRVPRRARAAAGALRPRGHHARARRAPREGAPRAPVCGADLRRLVVLAAQAGARCVRRRDAALRHRRGAAAPRAGQVLRQRPAQPALSLRLRPRDLRRRRHVPPQRLGRLRAHLGPRRRRRGPPVREARPACDALAGTVRVGSGRRAARVHGVAAVRRALGGR